MKAIKEFGTKRILSILITLCMLLALLPMQVHAANPGVETVTLGGKQLNYSDKYLVNGEPSKTGTLGSGGCTAFFDHDHDSTTSSLTLQDYDGGTISAGGVGAVDINIELVGTNKITGTDSDQVFGIRNSSPGGDINITSVNDASLTIKLTSTGNYVYGIATDSTGSSTKGNVTIGGKVDLKVNVTAESFASSMSAIGIYAKENVTIKDDVSYEAICKSNTSSDALQAGTGIYAGKGAILTTTGNINIDTSQCGVYNYGIYGNSGNPHLLENVESMTIKWKHTVPPAHDNGGPIIPIAFSNEIDVEENYVIKKDTTNHIATYRKGTPRTLTITDGSDIEGLFSNKYLAGDPVTVTANAPEKNFKFKEWTASDLTSVDLKQNPMTFIMPANNVSLTATYEQAVFTVQPENATGYVGKNIQFNWTIGAYEGMVYYAILQTKNGTEWEDINNLPDEYENPGYHTYDGYSDIVGSKTFRLHYHIFPTEFYSDEFTLTWAPAQVTGITMSPTSASVEKGETKQFTATVLGNGSFNNGVTWKVENNIDGSTQITQDGLLTVSSIETAPTLTVTATADGDVGKSATATVTVTEPAPTITGVAIKTPPTKVTYTAGELLDLSGLEVTLTKSDASTEDVAFVDFDAKGITTVKAHGTALVEADTEVVISVNGQTVNQVITVNPAPTITGVAIKTAPTKLAYTAGELLDLSGLVVTLTKSDASTEDVAFADFDAKGITTVKADGTALVEADTEVVISVNGQTVNQVITVNPAPTVTSVEVKTPPTKVTYTAGELLDLSGLVVTLTKSDLTTIDVAFADFAANSITTSLANGAVLATTDTVVTITINSKTATQTITVTPVPTVTGVTIKTAPTKIAYTAGELLDLSGLVVTLTKSDLTTIDVAFADFAANSITTSLANGAVLATTDTVVTITVNSKTATQTITVTPVPTVTGVTIKTAPTKIAYTAGELLDLSGLVVTLTKSDLTTIDVAFADFAANSITTSLANGAVLATTDTVVTITANLKTVDQIITVIPVPITVTGVAIKTAPAKVAYTAGELLDLSGLVVTLTKSDLTTIDVAFADFAANSITTSLANGAVLATTDTVVTITANSKTADQTITVIPVPPVIVTGVTVKTAPTKVAYTAGELLDLSGLVVTLTKSDSTTEDVALANFASKGITTSLANGAVLATTDTAITITVNAKTVAQAITVTAGGGGYYPPPTSYIISTIIGEGGSVDTAQFVRVDVGGSAEFNITPDAGYEIENVKVDGISVGAINYYVFTNVNGYHNISVSFKKITPADEVFNKFTDVPEEAWFHDAVKMAIEKGWFLGTSDTTFSPNALLTRGMVVSILWRIEDKPTALKHSFTDVADGAYYADAISWASEHGIVNGYGDELFGPEDNVSREQLAIILYRYAELKKHDVSATNDLAGFTDANEVSSYALDVMRWAVGSGLMNGKGDGILDPLGKATRAEVATMLKNFLDKIS